MSRLLHLEELRFIMSSAIKGISFQEAMMPRLSVQLRDAYLRELETQAGDTIYISDLDAFGSSGMFVDEIKAALTDEGEQVLENFTVVKNGGGVTIKADHVYRRFLNGERWNRHLSTPDTTPPDIPTIEALKELHPKMGEKVKPISTPKPRGRKPAAEGADGDAPKSRKRKPAEASDPAEEPAAESSADEAVATA